MTALAAAERLIGVLEAENTALHQSNVAGLGALLTEKLAAVQALDKLPVTPEAAAVAQHLRMLMDENRQLLERAIAVQSRVVEAVARAAQLMMRDAGRYGATGAPTQDRGAIALVTNA